MQEIENFLPYFSQIQPNKNVPINPPKHSNEPIHEICSSFNGPPVNGVSLD